MSLNCGHRAIVVAIFIFLQGLITFPVFASVTGTAEVYPRLVRKGDSFQVTLTIQSDKSIRFQNVDFPAIDGVTLDANFISDGQSIAHSGQNQQFSYTKTRMYSADLVGQYDIGPFRINYDTDDELGKEVMIEPVSVEVYEDAPRPASTIIFGENTPWWKYLMIPALLALLAGLVWAWVRMRRKKPSVTATPLVATAFRTLEQVTVEKVKAPEFPNADDFAKVREYYDAVDDILREYLAGRFEIRVVDSTSYEIRLEFTRRKRLDARAGGVLKLINDCDWVKFAKTHPVDVEIRQVPERVAQALLAKT